MFALLDDFKSLKKKVRCLECKPSFSITQEEIDLWNTPEAGGIGYSGVANNYSALPAAASVSGQFWYVLHSQGTSWLPGTLGGTYYPDGTYYSTGTEWITNITPEQATQGDVDAGVITDQFVSPFTLKNAAQWATKLNSSSFSGFAKITVGTVAPSSPGVNDLWVDTN